MIEEFATLSGLSPWTIDGMLRPLRAAGLIPTGGRGGGKSAAPFNLSHLTSVLLAFGGTLPSDAADAVKAVQDLPAEISWTGNTPAWEEKFLFSSIRSGCTLRDGVETLVDYLAFLEGAEFERIYDAMYKRDWKLELSKSAAAMSWMRFSPIKSGSNDGGYTYSDVVRYYIIFRRPEDIPKEGFQEIFYGRGILRKTEIFVNVLAATSRLWRDTKDRRYLPQPMGAASTTAALMPENVNPLPQGLTPSSHEQDQTGGPAVSTTPHDKERSTNSQALPKSGRGRSPRRQKGAADDPPIEEHDAQRSGKRRRARPPTSRA